MFKSTAFHRYLISYLIVFFIPLLVMSVLIYYQSIAALKDEIEKTNTNKLKQVSDITDTRIREMWDIAALITYDPHLTPYMVSHPYTQIDAIDKLSIYKSSSAIIDQIFLYYDGDENIYSDRGYYSLDTFTDRVLNLSERAKREFTDRLRQSEAPSDVPLGRFATNNGESRDLIAFFHPIPPSDSLHYGSVLYFVRKSVYSSMINNTLGDFKGNVYIINRNNEVIASDNNGGAVKNDALERLALVSRPGVDTAKVGGENYSIVTVRSGTSGWTFVAAIPTEQFFSRVFHIQLFLLAVLISLALTGLVLAMVFAARQYKPIKSLMDYMQTNRSRFFRQEPVFHSRSVNETVEGFIKNHDWLRSKVSSQEPFVRDQCLLKILRGDWSSEEEVLQIVASIGIVFPHPYYFVVYISFDGGSYQDTKTKGALLRSPEADNDDQEAASWGVELIHDNAIAVIVNCARNDPGLAETTVDGLLTQIGQVGSAAALGVGTFYRVITDVHNSFVEASSAVEFKLAGGAGSVTYFKQVARTVKPNDWYAGDTQIRLAHSLKKGNERAAVEAVDAMLEQIVTEQTSVDLMKCYCFDIINLIFRAATEVNYASPERMKEIVNFTSVKSLKPPIHQFIHGLCLKVEENKERESRMLHEQILAYIQAHYKTYELSLDRLAAHFNLSESYLSRFIREKTGINFMQYVWQLRIDEAKRQLVETDTAIRDIVQDVGYIDVPNFSRKFKKTEGITPGEYRKLHT